LTAQIGSFNLSGRIPEFDGIRRVAVWMCASPVACGNTFAPQRLWWLYGLNPMAGVIDGFRWVLTERGVAPGLQMLASASAVMVVPSTASSSSIAWSPPLPTESSLKHLAKRRFAAFGLELRREPADSSSPRASISGALHQLSSLGFQPATVIEAGVATQTLELYESLLSVRFLLSEPLAEFEPFLQRICATYRSS
jgi:hypothetical protein